MERGGVIDLAPGVEARGLYPPGDPPPGAPMTAASRALVLQVSVAEGRGGEWRALLLPDAADGRAARWLAAHETSGALRDLPGVEFIAQEDSGAVNLRVYPDKVEARGFVDGRKIVLPR